MKADGHIHTPFCPHGSKDLLEEYIKRAIELNFVEISFTEHAPLPDSFEDPTPDQDSAMLKKDVESYISEIQLLKKKYKQDIKINVGFEVDFIEGYEKETTQFLNEYGSFIDDAILSVHFLKHNSDYVCIDFGTAMFADIISTFGTIEEVYDSYFQTVKKSILADLGPCKPKRIGHITLVHKFQRQFPCARSFTNEIRNILHLLQEQKLQLDYNGAGVGKPFCKEPYPPNWVVTEALERNIPLIYGSDAHAVNGLNQGFDTLIHQGHFTSPTKSK